MREDCVAAFADNCIPALISKRNGSSSSVGINLLEASHAALSLSTEEFLDFTLTCSPFNAVAILASRACFVIHERLLLTLLGVPRFAIDLLTRARPAVLYLEPSDISIIRRPFYFVRSLSAPKGGASRSCLPVPLRNLDREINEANGGAIR